MNNVTQFPEPAIEEETEPSKFSIAYAKWRKALANIDELENAGHGLKGNTPEYKQHEDAVSTASDIERDAVWEMIQAPAEKQLDIVRRAHVTQELFLCGDWEGWWTDRRHLMMLQRLVLDLQSATS